MTNPQDERQQKNHYKEPQIKIRTVVHKKLAQQFGISKSTNQVFSSKLKGRNYVKKKKKSADHITLFFSLIATSFTYPAVIHIVRRWTLLKKY